MAQAMLNQAGKPVKVIINKDLSVKVYKRADEPAMVKLRYKKKMMCLPLSDWAELVALKDCIALASDFTRGIVGMEVDDLPTYTSVVEEEPTCTGTKMTHNTFTELQ